MKNKKEFFKGIGEETVSVAKDYVDETALEKFQTHISEKLQTYKPTLMVYGVYNAGKSTLLNALFGQEEMAKTGDAPETDSIGSYEYNGYTIYDTPGINAPIEHEEITMEHLSKTEMVLFVMSNSGAVESREVYERLIGIVEANKPVLIVLNDKDGIGRDSSQIDNQINKINQNLNKIADEKGMKDIDNVISIEYVDAKTALEGKVENEEELIEESNIRILEAKIQLLLKNAGSYEVENALKEYIAGFVNNILSDIDDKINNKELQSLQRLATNFEKLKQRVEVELKNIALESVRIVTNNFFEIMLSGKSDAIEDIVKKGIEDTTRKIQEKLAEVIREIKEDIEDFNVELKQSNIQIDTTFRLEMKSEAFQDGTMQGSSTTSSEMIIAAESITTLLPPVVPIGSFPVPVRAIAQLAIAIFGIFSGSDEAQMRAEAKLEEKKMLHLSAKNRSEEFGANFKAEVLKMIDNDLNSIFKTLFENIQLLSQKIDSENKKVLEDKKRLMELLDRMEN